MPASLSACLPARVHAFLPALPAHRSCGGTLRPFASCPAVLQEAAAALRALEAEKAAKEAADARAHELQEMLDNVSAALGAPLLCVLLLWVWELQIRRGWTL